MVAPKRGCFLVFFWGFVLALLCLSSVAAESEFCQQEDNATSCDAFANDQAEDMHSNDDIRLRAMLEQSISMRNYTALGFKKLEAPETIFKLLQDFWSNNSKNVSNNESNPDLVGGRPTKLDLQSRSFVGGGTKLKDAICSRVRSLLQDWTRKYLATCDIVGIDLHYNGSVVHPRVESTPASAIINVRQDLQEPWLLELWGHDGKRYNITMNPGDMIFYESHSVIHGRPKPLRGKYSADVIVKFDVIGSMSDAGDYFYLNDQDRESRDAGLPPYIIPGSPWEEEWKKKPDGWKQLSPLDPHKAAAIGHLEELQIIAALNKTRLFEEDKRGWQPIHHAARAAQIGSIRFLLESGANVDAAISKGNNMYTPLEIAVNYRGTGSAVSSFLRENGATLGK